MATIFIMRDGTAVLAPVDGSKNDAKDKPICKPMNSPAVWTAAKAMRMVRPSAVQISTCWAAMRSPANEAGGLAGTWPSVGATTRVSAAATASFIRTGIDDGTSDVQEKSVSVSVDLGGRRRKNKKNN